MNLSEVKMYAIKCHTETNHFYDKQFPYHYHLQMAVHIGLQFINLIPEKDRDNVIGAIWCHDTVEDARQTYSDVIKATNYEIAEMVYAVTNEKGRNRTERANRKYYDGIVETKYATFVKLCDRIANVKHSKKTGNMLEMYRKENKYFRSMLYSFVSDYKIMFAYLDDLLND